MSNEEDISAIDAIAVNPRNGFVERAIIDDKEWEDYDRHMTWLLDKLNAYIGFVFSGQINEHPAYAGRPIKFAIHFKEPPPRAARLTLLRMRDHLGAQQVAFAVTETGVITEEVDIESWAKS